MKIPKLNPQEVFFMVLRVLLLLMLLFVPHSYGYSYKYYYHVLGFMMLPFTLGFIPVLFNLKGLWKWATFALGTILTIVLLGFNFFTRTNIAYLGNDGFRKLDKSNANFVFTVTKNDRQKITDSSYIVFLKPNCQTCRDTVPMLRGLTGSEQTAIAYVDVDTDFGSEYVKQFPNVDKVPVAYNRQTGELLRLGYHTDYGTEILKENIAKIAEETKY